MVVVKVHSLYKGVEQFLLAFLVVHVRGSEMLQVRKQRLSCDRLACLCLSYQNTSVELCSFRLQILQMFFGGGGDDTLVDGKHYIRYCLFDLLLPFHQIGNLGLSYVALLIIKHLLHNPLHHIWSEDILTDSSCNLALQEVAANCLFVARSLGALFVTNIVIVAIAVLARSRHSYHMGFALSAEQLACQ